MAQTWKYAIGLGMLGATLAAGCTVTSGDDDSTSGASGEAGTGGSGGSTGGSGGKGGSSGKGGAAGKGGSAGTAGTAGKGGSAGTAGTGGSTGGTAGVGGSSGASGDGSGGTSGTNSDPVATCDPEQGTLASEPFDSCEPSEDATGDALECQECMESACCEETKICYGTDLYNVCGWGGPTDGEYAGKNEIGCFIKCLTDYVVENEFCDSDGASDCAVECATPKCSEGAGQFPLVGNATSDLAGCLQLNCSDECFGADTCED